MTTTPERSDQRVDLVTVTIDGIEVQVARDTLVIRAAEQAGVQIPRFCDHPLLAPVGACRQCLVDIPDAGNGRGFPKPQASCTLPVAEGMVVSTQASSPAADKAQQGVMEFLLINHPLDCPVCDKGGECPLQNQAMSNGRGSSRFAGSGSGGLKRTFPKPINLSPQILLDRERCIVCQRCTRFVEQIPGDPFISLVERGAQQQIGIASTPVNGGAGVAGSELGFTSYFSGNIIQICPVGALTSESYRFRSRPFDLVSVPSVAEHDACGSAIRIDHRRGKVLRRLAGDDPEVNEEWITDKDRFAFAYAVSEDRITYPRIREDGELRPASWPEAFAVAARGLAQARGRAGVGVLTGGRVTLEDAYAYAKFARIALGTNDVDFRARPLSREETDFLGAHVAGGPVAGQAPVTMTDLEGASTVVLAGLEPEDEAGAIFLRLRKASEHHGLRVLAVAPYTTPGLTKMNGTLVPTAPGDEPAALASLLGHADGAGLGALDASSIVLVGERLAAVPGALSAAVDLVAKTGARLAWVPRRAGDRGAVEAGALPTLLPGGRPVADAAARVDVAAIWGVEALPEPPGRDADQIVAALIAGDLSGLVIGGVDPDDTADPAAFRQALTAATFVVALDLRETVVTAAADVVFPVAAAVEKAGTFLTWEGRPRPFEAALARPSSLPDLRILSGIAEELGAPLGFRTVAQARWELAEIGGWDGDRVTMTPTPAEGVHSEPGKGAKGQLLATWRQLIDHGSLQHGDPHLAASARPAVVVVPPAVHAALGPVVTVTGDRGQVSLPSLAADDMVEGVVWLPLRSTGAGLLADVASPGSRVTVTGGDPR